MGPAMMSHLISPYYICPPVPNDGPWDLEKVYEQIQTDAAECKLIVNESHETLHRLAHEVLMFMMCDKDRLQDENLPNAMPLAYALKGNSITTQQV